jgi:hypothetical protein
VLAPVVFRAANMWLPAEKIVLKNEPSIVGYVLAADPRYATVLKAADSTVQIRELDGVESRTICRLNPGLESASLVRYIAGSASKHTPRARGYGAEVNGSPYHYLFVRFPSSGSGGVFGHGHHDHRVSS